SAARSWFEPIPISAVEHSWLPVPHARSSAAAYIQKSRQDRRRVEMIASDFAGPARMPRVTAVDLIDAGERLFRRRKCEQPLAVRQVPGPPGVLHQRRPSGSEIALGPIAEPSRSGRDIGVLGD